MSKGQKKPKIGDVIKSDGKFDYVVTEIGPQLLFKVQYDNLEENFSELAPVNKIRLKGSKSSLCPNTKDTPFLSEGDKVDALLFNEWKSATILGSQFADFEITCYKKGTKKSYFSEWITLAAAGDSMANKLPSIQESPKQIQPEDIDKLTVEKIMNTADFSDIQERVDTIALSENWDDVLSSLKKTFIKPNWDGKPIGDDFHVFFLADPFDRQFTKKMIRLLESAKLSVTTKEEEIHKARVLLLLYTDNNSYDARVIRLLTRGAELANMGELCIIVLVHPTCSVYRQNKLPDNMAYSLADSKWYSLIGIDSPIVSFHEMVDQIKNYTCTSSLNVTDVTSMAGLWYCKIVVSGDFCSNFYDNKAMTLYLNSEKGRIYGRTPSGLILEGTVNEDRIIDIVGAYVGPWKQQNEGWDEDYYQVMIRIKGVLDYKGDRFEGQFSEVSKFNDKLYECVGTLSATLQNQGVSGFYEIVDALSSLKGEKTYMAIVHQRGGDIVLDLQGYHGSIFPGIIDTISRKFWIYIKTAPFTCMTYEGSFNLKSDDKTLQLEGAFFKCQNGLTSIPSTKFTGKSILPDGLIKVQKTESSGGLEELIDSAQQRSLRTSIINSYTFIPPCEGDFPTVIIGAKEDIDIRDELRINLVKAGVSPVSCHEDDLHRARTVCLIMTTRICDNKELISLIKHVASKSVPFFIIGTDARRVIFNDKNWKDLDMKEKLLSCLARLKQTGKLSLDPKSLLFKSLVKEIKNHYKAPNYFLSGMWSIRTFSKETTKNDYEEARIDARKGKQKSVTVPKLVYILCDGATGHIVGINDFISNKQFKGKVDTENATFSFDNDDSKYELVIEQDGQSMQGTYTNRVHNYEMEVSLTLEMDDVSGVYSLPKQNLMIGIVKTGQQTVDVHYNNYVLPGVFVNNSFYCTIPRCVRRKPMVSTICGVLQKSMSGITLICFEYSSLCNMKCLIYEFEYLQSKFQKLDEIDKINVDCEPTVIDTIERYIDAFNNIDYDEYMDLHSDKLIESEESFEAYCRHAHDIIGTIENYDFVGKRTMTERTLVHLSISRYEFDFTYSNKVRREFFIIDENCKLKGNLSLEEEAMQFHSSIYDVMITYRSTDSGWADYLQSYLESNEILCWRDQRMEIGANWSSDITSAIRLAKCELCLLSEEYLKSEMCTKEISLAYDSGKIIIPVVLPYTDQSKKRPLVKTTYKPPYPPHQISHETSQSTWIDFRPSSSDVDPTNVEEFEDAYHTPLTILLNRLKLSKSRSHICDINGEWILFIKDTMDRSIKNKLALEHVGRIPNGILQEQSGKPVARLSSQSIISGTRLLLFFIHPQSKELILGIKAMMSGDNRSFSGVLLSSDHRSTVYGQKVENKFRPVSRGPLVFTGSDRPEPNFDLLSQNFPQYSRQEIEDMFDKFCEIDTSNDYRLTADEIVLCLKSVGKPMPKRIVLEQIRKFDVKQSGVLEFDEFLKFLSMSAKGGWANHAASAVCSIQ